MLREEGGMITTTKIRKALTEHKQDTVRGDRHTVYTCTNCNQSTTDCFFFFFVAGLDSLPCLWLDLFKKSLQGSCRLQTFADRFTGRKVNYPDAGHLKDRAKCPVKYPIYMTFSSIYLLLDRYIQEMS